MSFRTITTTTIVGTLDLFPLAINPGLHVKTKELTSFVRIPISSHASHH